MNGSKIIFVGGIHAVGKGTLFEKICKQTGFVHLTASEILKWTEISKPNNKKVNNTQATQDRLIAGLDKVLKKNESYLLDGHFCLLNSEAEVEKVPIETFEKIAPKLIAIITAEVNLIKERLEKRDKREYSFDLLKSMQTFEKEYAQQILSKLKVPFVEIKEGNYQSLIEIL